jgi:ABC-type branched-subunit amino acid transport system permease subunit
MSGILNVDFWIFVAVIAGIYTIFALGIQLEFGVAGLNNFGQVAFMAVSAYTMAILIVRFEVPMILAASAGILAAIVLGLVLGIPTLRLRADYLAMATIAAGEIVRYLAVNLQWLTGGPVGTVNLAGPGKLASYNDEWLAFQGWVQQLLAGMVGSAAATRDLAMLVVVWPVALVLVALIALMVRSPWGRALRAVREDEGAAAALGKNVFRLKMQALLIGSALGGLAGVFLAWQLSIFSPADFRPTFTFFAYIIVILGGMTNSWAVPVGALIFGVLYAGTRFLDFFPLNLVGSGDRAFLRLLIVGLALVLLMMYRPQGLFGKRKELVLEQQ